MHDHLNVKHIRKGHWSKWHHKKLFDFLHKATHHQIGFIRELAHQKITGKPSPHYGVMIPFAGSIDKDTYKFIHQQSSYSRPHFIDAIASDKKAASGLSSIGKFVSAGVKDLTAWSGKAMKYAQEYIPKISKYVNIASDVAGVVGGAGSMLGLWDDDVAKSIGDVTKGIKDFTKGFEKKDDVASEAKPGGYLYL